MPNITDNLIDPTPTHDYHITVDNMNGLWFYTVYYKVLGKDPEMPLANITLTQPIRKCGSFQDRKTAIEDAMDYIYELEHGVARGKKFNQPADAGGIFDGDPEEVRFIMIHDKYQIYLLNREGTWSYTIYRHSDGMLEPIVDSDRITVVETIRSDSFLFADRESALKAAMAEIKAHEERVVEVRGGISG